MAEHRIGVVIHYWDKIGVAGVRLTGSPNPDTTSV